MSDVLPGFFERLFLAWAAYFRILFDAAYAARVRAAADATPALPAAKEPEKEPAPKEPAPKAAVETPPHDAALQLLALLQREGRFVDFLEEDVTGFSDADVGAAARVVHEGCRKALRGHGKLAPVRTEDEGARVRVEASETRRGAVKLTGNVAGSAPFEGALRHRGWRIDDLRIPATADGHDAHVVAPAEVEL